MDLLSPFFERPRILFDAANLAIGKVSSVVFSTTRGVDGSFVSIFRKATRILFDVAKLALGKVSSVVFSTTRGVDG